MDGTYRVAKPTPKCRKLNRDDLDGFIVFDQNSSSTNSALSYCPGSSVNTRSSSSSSNDSDMSDNQDGDRLGVVEARAWLVGGKKRDERHEKEQDRKREREGTKKRGPRQDILECFGRPVKRLKRKVKSELGEDSDVQEDVDVKKESDDEEDCEPDQYAKSQQESRSRKSARVTTRIKRESHASDVEENMEVEVQSPLRPITALYSSAVTRASMSSVEVSARVTIDRLLRVHRKEVELEFRYPSVRKYKQLCTERKIYEDLAIQFISHQSSTSTSFKDKTTQLALCDR